eukprot:5303191-Prymnesium_polylepis.1
MKRYRGTENCKKRRAALNGSRQCMLLPSVTRRLHVTPRIELYLWGANCKECTAHRHTGRTGPGVRTRGADCPLPNAL